MFIDTVNNKLYIRVEFRFLRTRTAGEKRILKLSHTHTHTMHPNRTFNDFNGNLLCLIHFFNDCSRWF